jgi:predicted DNA repair protein MutK
MPSSSFFALLDDIATLLDDVAVMTKVATKKTAGVLGDDLALNAQQVAGVNADRELPVVWAVAKGSAVNKMILVPAALIISAFAPWAIKPLLMIGGAFLCFEGVEKLFHKFFHSEKEEDQHHADLVKAVADAKIDMVQWERDKIKGAVRTDFILSAEIIVISLGAVAAKTFATQIGVLIGVAVIMTIGVYGLVGAIVKLDDLGLWCVRDLANSVFATAKRGFGRFLLWGAPKLMKFLSVAGTAAMFLVGGHILVEGIAALHHFGLGVQARTFGFLLSMLFDMVVGIAAGSLVLVAVVCVQKLRGKQA